MLRTLCPEAREAAYRRKADAEEEEEVAEEGGDGEGEGGSDGRRGSSSGGGVGALGPRSRRVGECQRQCGAAARARTVGLAQRRGGRRGRGGHALREGLARLVERTHGFAADAEAAGPMRTAYGTLKEEMANPILPASTSRSSISCVAARLICSLLRKYTVVPTHSSGKMRQLNFLSTDLWSATSSSSPPA
ncbi:MAG: hypothetical protein VX017_09700, partial [Pseudomonadota bacterium]|nr:hypothetical protein [Pseudomonadota bacterium]